MNLKKVIIESASAVMLACGIGIANSSQLVHAKVYHTINSAEEHTNSRKWKIKDKLYKKNKYVSAYSQHAYIHGKLVYDGRDNLGYCGKGFVNNQFIDFNGTKLKLNKAIFLHLIYDGQMLVEGTFTYKGKKPTSMAEYLEYDAPLGNLYLGGKKEDDYYHMGLDPTNFRDDPTPIPDEIFKTCKYYSELKNTFKRIKHGQTVKVAIPYTEIPDSISLSDKVISLHLLAGDKEAKVKTTHYTWNEYAEWATSDEHWQEEQEYFKSRPDDDD